ncbi:histidine phosphatase superfamily [Pseudomassariella vexata]|uniref:Histidine phosphatase superfamily n=1 Tax=Pseudomassariella vexata TaxID=1141098 RepID=A0A1Y2DXM6_9PEZI|nr:histidine phosphatase superfamily [Pseudomassariella vexata]ORY64021.1 histidine phosphatase superfamily [Pseudomassariella vexata]
MGRPRLIILIRHAQSEGNKNREIHQSIPDHRVKLTQDGWAQAHEAGLRLRSLLRADDTLHFFTSPYRRTRETTEGILETLTSDDPEPTPFKRSNIKVYEEPRLREQDFGNFQPCSAEMERMWQERADYGHFFYRIPNGESAADAYDRVSGFNESLWRQFGEDDFASVCVLVTHGLMSRVFLMKWYHFSVEYFEDLRNVNHCEFLIMKKQADSGKYILENKLRTWSELRRERAAIKAKEDAEQGKNVEGVSKKIEGLKLERQNSSQVVAQRRWGGCPEGCDHGKHFKVRGDLAELRQVDEIHSAKHSIIITNGHHCGTIASRRPNAIRQPNNSEDDSDDPRGHSVPQIDINKARDEVVSSPDGTPSYITVEDRMRSHLKSPALNKPPFLHVGRDFGGTYSGRPSAANSDADTSEEDARQRLAVRPARVRGAKAEAGAATNGITTAANDVNGAGKDDYLEHGKGRRTFANRLGDAPASGSDHASEDGGDEREPDEELGKAEEEDRSLVGSVY